MNLFLRSHRIAAVDKHFSETNASWCFCITYTEGSVQQPYIQQVRKEKIDYREVLDEKTFARFARLREARKQIANEEAIPAYSVFTNEELAAIAAFDDLAEGSIASIAGIGDKRAAKYEKRLLDLYRTLSAT